MICSMLIRVLMCEIEKSGLSYQYKFEACLWWEKPPLQKRTKWIWLILKWNAINEKEKAKLQETAQRKFGVFGE